MENLQEFFFVKFGNSVFTDPMFSLLKCNVRTMDLLKAEKINFLHSLGLVVKYKMCKCLGPLFKKTGLQRIQKQSCLKYKTLKI